MSRYAGMIRNQESMESALTETIDELEHLTEKLQPVLSGQLGAFYHLRDMLLSQVVYISAMIDYKKSGGESRGSALYTDIDGEKTNSAIPDLFRCRIDNGKKGQVIQEVIYSPEQISEKRVSVDWRPVRPIPNLDYFFENEWKKYRDRCRQ